MLRTLIVALVVLCRPVWAAPADDSGNELANPGFERGAANSLEGWRGYGRGYTVDHKVFRSGGRSIKCIARGERDGMGAEQVIQYDKPDRRPVIVGGWCKTDNVSGGGDCSVYLDIIYADGTPLWGKTNSWGRGTHDWEYNARIYWPAKPIKEIRAFVFLRRTTGAAWFDDIKVCREGLHLTDICVASDHPRRRGGLRVTARLTRKADWTCRVVDQANAELASARGSGREIAWFWPGKGAARPAAVQIAAEDTGRGRTEFRAPVKLPSYENLVREGYAVWTQGPMRKVYPTDNPPRDALKATAVTLARNERDGFQIAIKPADSAPLHRVRVEIGPLVSEAGHALPEGAIQCRVVGYVWVATPSGHPSAPRLPNWCPDPLLPAKPFDVVHGRTQTVWVNVFAPERTQPGTYRGKVTIRPANAPATEVALNLRVRRFALPRAPRMKTAFAIMDGFTKQMYGKLTPELRRRCIDIMLEHRLNPDDISRTDPPRIEDLLYARERGMNAFNILNLVPKPKGNPLWVCASPMSAYGPDFNQQLAARLDGYVAELRKHGLSKMAYFYGFDERRQEYDELIKGICKSLKQRYPEVSTFTTAGYMYAKGEKTPLDYQDYMDWYCPLTPRYSVELSDKLRAAGKQVWWYVCCGPKHPYANFSSMDYPAVEGRLLAWMTWAYKADGLLFWHVNYWGKNRIVDWEDPYLDWEPTCIARMTGDGCLTYPTPEGPASCIRLENIRDGIEDYDYLSLLADAKGREVAMELAGRLIKSMTDYTRDPAAVSQVRDEIAALIEAGK